MTGVLGALNRAVGWLTPDPLALATRRLELLALDRGEAFGPRVEAPEGDGPGREAEFSACVYHAAFEAEGRWGWPPLARGRGTPPPPPSEKSK